MTRTTVSLLLRSRHYVILFFILGSLFLSYQILYLYNNITPTDDNDTRRSNNNVRSSSPTSSPPVVKLFLGRTIGNALPPRHHPNQTLSNLEFILKHEASAEYIDKHWFLNRIVDPVEESSVIALLKRYNASYTIFSFNLADYANRTLDLLRLRNSVDSTHDIQFDAEKQKYKNLHNSRTALSRIYEDKILYAIDVNGMRNRMIDFTISSSYDWILPWDQNCFLTTSAIQNISDTIQTEGLSTKYFITYMDRVTTDNSILLNSSYVPNAWEEPQVIFRRDASERFDEALRYGLAEKASLLVRLNVPGPWWTTWGWEAREFTRAFNNMSKDLVPPQLSIPTAGWVARLNSGKAALETQDAGNTREWNRWLGVERLLTKLDIKVLEEIIEFNASSLLYFNPSKLSQLCQTWQSYQRNNETTTSSTATQQQYIPLLAQYGGILLNAAVEELGAEQQHLVSVMDKPKPAPSGSYRDYFVPVFIDGPDENIVHHHQEYETAEMYDGVRFEKLLEKCTVLAIAYKITNEEEFYDSAIRAIDTWFVKEETRMNPHFKFAGVLPLKYLGKAGYRYNHTRYVVFFLDALRLLRHKMPEEMYEAILQWFSKLQSHLLTDEKVRLDFYDTSSNVGGLYYDLHVASVSAFVNDKKAFVKTINFAPARLIRMFHRRTGEWLLPHDMKLLRHQTEAYLHDARQIEIRQALEGWSVLASIGKAGGVDIWSYKGGLSHTPQSVLCTAAQRNIPCCDGPSSNLCREGLESEVLEQWSFIASEALRHCPILRTFPTCRQMAISNPQKLAFLFEDSRDAEPVKFEGMASWRRHEMVRKSIMPYLHVWGILSRNETSTS